jgi:hypothetical protein
MYTMDTKNIACLHQKVYEGLSSNKKQISRSSFLCCIQDGNTYLLILPKILKLNILPVSFHVSAEV